jgi:hypothetical protein
MLFFIAPAAIFSNWCRSRQPEKLDESSPMGITIAYRGRLADLTRIEDFEDRLVDLVPAEGLAAQTAVSANVRPLRLHIDRI